MIFEELHATGFAVVTQQPERSDKVESKPRSRELLNQTRLVLFQSSENENRAQRRQPGDNRENIVSDKISHVVLWRSSKACDLKCQSKSIQNNKPKARLIAVAVSDAAFAMSELKNAITASIKPNTITSA